jgi:hypothetical protein
MTGDFSRRTQLMDLFSYFKYVETYRLSCIKWRRTNNQLSFYWKHRRYTHLREYLFILSSTVVKPLWLFLNYFGFTFVFRNIWFDANMINSPLTGTILGFVIQQRGLKLPLRVASWKLLKWFSQSYVTRRLSNVMSASWAGDLMRTGFEPLLTKEAHNEYWSSTLLDMRE